MRTAHNDEDDTYYGRQDECSDKGHCYRRKEDEGRDDPDGLEHLFELSAEATVHQVSAVELCL